MSGKTKYLVLEVDENRHNDLVDALLKRSYIKLADVNNINSREHLTVCPACLRGFSKVSHKTVDESLLWDILALLRGMKNHRSLVLYEKLEEVRPIDRERSVCFSLKNKKIAETLHLISSVVDGNTETFFVNAKCINFITDITPLSPSTLAISEGRILDISGELKIEQVITC